MLFSGYFFQYSPDKMDMAQLPTCTME